MMKTLFLLKRYCLPVVLLLTLALPARAGYVWECPIEWDGDVNRDGSVNIGDVTDLIDALLNDNLDAVQGDVNVNGVTDIGDVVDLIDMLLYEPDDELPIPLDTLIYNMIYVRSYTYMMGATTEQEPYASDNEREVHKVMQYPFYIGETEVTQELWQAVMGGNPSHFKGKRLPVQDVTWDEVQEFILRLNRFTGWRFRLPTEAEWELAARGGRNSRYLGHNYVYAGSNTLADVGWFDGNSSGRPNMVKTLAPNQLGLYDMSGNVWEWCQDYWAPSYSAEAVLNPLGPETGNSRVIRGGSWLNYTANCRVSSRSESDPATSSYTIGLRLAMDAPYNSWFMLSDKIIYIRKGSQRSVDILNGNGSYTVYNGNSQIAEASVSGEHLVVKGLNIGSTTVVVKDNLSGDKASVTVVVYNTSPTRPDKVDGVPFNMIYVEGGIFKMGATAEQGSDAYSNESPAHHVTLANYYIGETEVTQALWQAVMGSNPSSFTGDPARPVERVSWLDCVEFLDRLNEMTGNDYRLPTEAEWEYAARGGIFSQGFKYAGSDDVNAVAWYTSNSGNKTHAVATKQPNELGIYDMSGNVFEWCQDYLGTYSNGIQINPTGLVTGTSHMNRGGAWSSSARMSRVSYRRSSASSSVINTIGLRLAMDAPGTHRFGLSRHLVRMEVGEHRSVNILNGSGDYTYIHNTDIVSGDIEGETLLLTGLKEGIATVAVKDNLTGAQDLVTVIVTQRRPPELIPVLNDTIWMEFVKGGTFDMGGTPEMGSSNTTIGERPVHQVTLSSYYICNREVTQHLWYAVMGSNPSHFAPAAGYGDDLYKPVESVSWFDCQRFIARLNMLTGLNFRLPTEAEWEFAARGGTHRSGTRYAGSDILDDVAWHNGNSGSKTHHCRLKAPNELNLYDMTGNVCEWTSTRYHSYTEDAQMNPIGPTTSENYIYRGGAWNYVGATNRISARYDMIPNYCYSYVGLRLAMDAEEIDNPDDPSGPDGGGDLNPRFRLSRTVVTLEVGEQIDLSILHGSGNYTVINQEQYVLADVNGETLTLTGKAVGIEDVIVKDNERQAYALVTAIVVEPTPPHNVVLDDSVTFDMVYIPEGAFIMGNDAVPGAAPAHYVSVNDYFIGSTEVTNLMWRWVMDYPINWAATDLYKPVEGLSWEDCMDFIARLNEKTGREYRLPTEAEWEYAAMGANRSHGYIYAGGNTVDNVAWYWDNLPSQQIGTTGYGVQRVGRKQANEKGIYDMSGNVREWCQDWFGVYPMSIQVNPMGPESGSDRVVRGGCYLDSSDPCRVKARSAARQSMANYVGTGFRLAMDAVSDTVTPTPTPDHYVRLSLSESVIRIPVGGQRQVDIYHGSGSYTLYNNNPSIASCLVEGEKLSLTGLMVGTTVVKVVDNVTLSTALLTVIVYKPTSGDGPDELFNEPNMIFVHGGTFVRGATSDQGTTTDANEQPIHQVTVSNYYISQTEVTQRLWERIMGGNPSHFKGDKLPVEQVTWEDCQEFIRRLNQLTGRQYRMLTEAEWEYAARGGRLSMGYKYAGGNLMTPLGWYKGNSGSTTHEVAQKSANELGIYDMSGNVWEWCQDCYGPYGSDNLFNPVGLDPESSAGTVNRVLRGGAWDGVLGDCRVARRVSQPQDYSATNVGLRLAMDAPAGAPLTVDPRVVELKVDESETVNILNGTGDYSATGGGGVASFQLSGSSLTVTGLQVGTTTINIKDNITMARTVLTVIVTKTREKGQYNTITFWIRYISGGAFDMGATSEQIGAVADELPVHRTMVPSFGIGETEVTQELWQAVMGYNPSVNTGDPQLPVDNVSWEEAEQFMARLSDLCDKPYRLPTEAEWEYAARGGHYGSSYTYSGSNIVGNVAWYMHNSSGTTHPVASKARNSEWLYDMSGNVDEWCQDWYGPYSEEPVFDPIGPDTADYHVARGGRWDGLSNYCRVSARSAGGFGETLPGVRIAQEMPDAYWFGLSRYVVWLKVGGSRTVDIYNGSGSYTIYSSKPGVASYVLNGEKILLTGLKEGRTVLQVMDNVSHKHKTLTVIVRNPIVPWPDDPDPEPDPTPGLEGLLRMIYVHGGTFAMGATSEQGSDAADDENPSHLVTLPNYYISETEVTQALWKRVMGGNPSHIKGDNLPVEQVTWEECQVFISRLNSLTGRQYRLLTEAEWEYAARGGRYNSSYKYAGSNTIGNVAWYSGNSGSTAHAVKQKTKNILGIYDMSGNVGEWCQDTYGPYSADNQNNPVGVAADGAVMNRVVRGGTWDDDASACRVSSRASKPQDYSDSRIGLRLARDAANSGTDGLMVVTHRVVEMEVGEQVTVGITNGSGNYVAAGGGGIVSYSLSGSTLTLTGLSEGTTTVNVKDNTSGVWTIITVIVTQGEIPYKYRNVTFWIKYINGGAFDQGGTQEQGSSANANELPVHRSLVPAYGIGKTEVTQQLWQAVMGYNNSVNKGNLQLPVDNITWDEAQEFIARLSDIFDLPFRLPTEAEWEYAARGASGSKGYKYAGGNSAGTVAWYSGNSGGTTHAVGTKRANERKLYDMSGNVDEWCQDWYGPYSDEPAFDPMGPVTGSQHVARGGRWSSTAADCRVSARSAGGFGTTLPGLRVALEYPYSYYLSLTRQSLWMEVGDNRSVTIKNGSGSYTISSTVSGIVSYVVNGDKLSITAITPGHTTVTVLDNVAQESKTLSITVVEPAGTNEPEDVDGADFEMIYVRGGTFKMGATEEQGTDAYVREKPVHTVTLNDFKISNIEVTQELWQNVMGSNPSTFTGNLQYPVDNVSWEDCQLFISKLNEKTGKHYRLPTEAEWEYAARGGARSQGYKYAGSNTIGNIAWYNGNASSKTHVVGSTSMANELGIYDMSGNVMEWCQDWYGAYSEGAQVNPHGPASGSQRIMRGGSWNSAARSCRVSYRIYYAPTATGNQYGLRLAEDVDNPLRFGLSSTMLTMEPGDQQTVNILNGSGDYTLDAGSSVVTCVLSGETITVTANEVGATTVSITDNATGESAILTVLVTQPVAPFGLSQSELTMDVGQTATVTMVNGRGNYTVTSSVSGVVSYVISGETLTLTALKAGTTTLTVTDVLTQSTATVTITVNQPIIPLSLPFNELTMHVSDDTSETTSVAIINGSGNFSVSVDGTSVTASIDSKYLTISSVALGVSTIIVTDLITGDTASMVVTVLSWQRGDVNLDGVIDENDYGELYRIFKGRTPLSNYTADVNGDGDIIFDYATYIDVSDNTALINILYSDLMKSWNGYPFDDVSQNMAKYDIDGDGMIGIADFNSILYCAYNGSLPYGNGDLDGDGAVNWRDVCIFHVAFMRIQNLWPDGPTEHEYVDLGLPSGTLWATCNVGANRPEDYGNYFAWGETEPKTTYNQTTYKWYNNGTDELLTKYCTNSSFGIVDNKTELDPEDDAAYVNWGEQWRMPSDEQFEELYNYCTCHWTTLNGVNGRLYTGPNGNSFFLPAAGFRYNSTHYYAATKGYCWSRTLQNEVSLGADYLIFDSDDNLGGVDSDNRYYGFTVRPVRVSESTPIEEESFTVNGVTFKMITVPGGTFMMGDDNDYSAKPIHQVTLSDYKIGQTEVTQELWQAVMGSNPSVFKGNMLLPVDNVSWNECQDFILNLNQLSGMKFRLLTEAEWEFAARGGTRSHGYRYSGSDTIDVVAWCSDNSSRTTHPVATKRPNELGIYDMSGNLREWCQDWEGTYTSTAQINPHGPADHGDYAYRVCRGGDWLNSATPVTHRDANEPWSKVACFGFRIALDPDNSTKFRLAETVVTVEVGESKTVNILNGNGSYSVAGSTDNFTSTITNGKLKVTGTAAGTNTVTVTNTSTGATAVLTVIVTEPAVPTATPVISHETTNNAVIVTATGNGDVKLYVNGSLVENPYTLARGNQDYTVNVTATAQEEGKLISETATMVLTISALAPQSEGHEYVDLGLPSGTLWATCNVGASTPEEYGDYFAWGETEPKTNYNWATYKWCNGRDSTLTKYCNNSVFGTVDNKNELMLGDDAAYVNWGSSWRMPSDDQRQELLNNCTWLWTTRNGVNGYLVTGPNGKTIFFPAAGYRYYSSLYSAGSNGRYWTCDINGTRPNTARYIHFTSDGVLLYGGYRCMGHTVRAVRNTEPAPAEEETFTVNGVTFKMIKVEGGTFTMGATAEQGSDGGVTEKPAHQVTLSSYSIGQTEVTQELWKAVMGSNPSNFTGDLQRPVEKVSWSNCKTFITKLNQLTGRTFRLPTEAEWEFAARGGTKSLSYKYAGSNTVGDVAWYTSNSSSKTHPVMSKSANELGIYDMSGNVWEWVQDWYGSYSSTSQTNPTGPSSGTYRVLRGGGWDLDAKYCRVSSRFNRGLTPSDSRNWTGLRLAL